MKTKSLLPVYFRNTVSALAVSAISAASLLAVGCVHADQTKINNLDNLDLGTSWVSGTAPTTADVADFDSTYATTGTLNFGAAASWVGISITNSGGNVLINNAAADSLGIGASRIDMSASTVNLVLKSFTLNASQTWNIASGQSFRIGDTTATPSGGTTRAGTFTNNAAGSTITVTGGGTGFLDTTNNSLGNVNG